MLFLLSSQFYGPDMPPATVMELHIASEDSMSILQLLVNDKVAEYGYTSK
jgi:hypothetical protein